MGNAQSQTDFATEFLRIIHDQNRRQVLLLTQLLEPTIIPCWRDMPWDGREQLKKELCEFSTKRPSIPMANIGLFGLVGSGKSSFCNTIDSIFKGRFSGRSETGSASESVTKHFRKYRPGGKNGPRLYLCDTMGMEEDQGLEVEDVPYILDGNIPDRFMFSVDTRVTPGCRGFIKTPRSADRMHCICYVLDATKAALGSRDTVNKIKKIKSLASARDIQFVILLTKIDQLCPEVRKCHSNAYKSFVVYKVVKDISEISGLPISYIYLVKNYSSEQEVDSVTDVLALAAIKQFFAFALDVIED